MESAFVSFKDYCPLVFTLHSKLTAAVETKQTLDTTNTKLYVFGRKKKKRNSRVHFMVHN